MARFIHTAAHPYARAHQGARVGDSEVVTPSRLAARALAVRPQSLRHLALKQIEAHGYALASPLQAQAILRQVLQATLQPADLLGTARSWMPTVQALLQSSPQIADLPAGLSPRAQSLVRVAQQYQAALHQQGLLESCELLWRAAECSPEPRQLLLYGYFQPRQDELAWMDAVAAEDSVLFLPTGDNPLFADVQASLDWLVRRGWAVVADDLPPQTLGESLCQRWVLGKTQAIPKLDTGPAAYTYSTFEAEVRGTLAQVKALLSNGVAARDIAIIARNETAYGPQLIDIAWEYGVPLRALYETPLLSTRLGAWLSLLLEVIAKGFPFEATAKLLSHPLASNPDAGFWSAVRGRRPQGFNPWQALAEDRLKLDLSALAQVNQSRRRDTWVSWWQSLLKTFDLRRRCARWARESIAFNRLRAGLVELSRPEQEVLSWAEFRQQLVDLLESLRVPAQPGRGGVELHTPTSVVGARYTHVFVMGMAEGTLPAPISNDPVLDFFERKQLQGQGIPLPGAAEQARREALSFYSLLQTVAGQVTFSYARLKDRQAQMASPYLDLLKIEAQPPPPLPIASPEELRQVSLRQPHPPDDAVLRQASHAFVVEQHRESSRPPDAYDGVIGIPFDDSDWTFSVSQLRTLGQCPFKWFAQKLLKLGTPEEGDEDLSASLMGTLYHRVLELVVAEHQQNPALGLADPDRLATKFTLAEQELLPPNLPNWSARREEHLRCLARVLQDPDFLPLGSEPVVLEGAFAGEWYGLRVKGQVDRIDRTEVGLVLIDYKTGKSRPSGIKDQAGKAWIDVQLPLYQDVAGPDLCPDETVAAAYYYSLRGRQKIAMSSKAPQHELPRALERCKKTLKTGSYAVQPDNARIACQYCDFDTLCRQGSRLSRKENPHGTD